MKFHPDACYQRKDKSGRRGTTGKGERGGGKLEGINRQYSNNCKLECHRLSQVKGISNEDLTIEIFNLTHWKGRSGRPGAPRGETNSLCCG